MSPRTTDGAVDGEDNGDDNGNDVVAGGVWRENSLFDKGGVDEWSGDSGREGGLVEKAILRRRRMLCFRTDIVDGVLLLPCPDAASVRSDKVSIPTTLLGTCASLSVPLDPPNVFVLFSLTLELGELEGDGTKWSVSRLSINVGSFVFDTWVVLDDLLLAKRMAWRRQDVGAV